MEIKASTRKVQFGTCALDEGRGVLIAPGGAETTLRPKTLDLLRLMLRNPGRVVAREAILDAVWPGLFVTDDSITQCVVELRRAMGSAGASLLRTVPRRGYLLDAEVAEIAPVRAEPMLTPRSDDRPSIAVLPFRKGNADPEEAYFQDGIIEGIVHVLSGLDGLFVISRGSALAFAQVTTDARAAARELGVRYVLYGGVRRAGSRLRITTELTDAGTGVVLRADRYDDDSANLFALQDRIAEAVASSVLPQLRAQELSRALRKAPNSLNAYDLVLRALDQLQRLNPDAFANARLLLDRAIAADPDYAAARSYSAWWHMLRIGQGWSGDVAADHDAADRDAAAALDRDRHDALGLAIRGAVLGYVRRDFAAGRAMLDRAVGLSPSCALGWAYGAGLRCWQDEGAEALIWAERGLRLAPLDPFTFLHEHMVAQAHYTLGNHDQAVAWAQRSAASNRVHAPNLRTLTASLVASGRMEEAAAAARLLLSAEPDFRLAAFAARTPLPGPMRDAFVERLRLAGLPE